jgi:peptidoglycan/LPS O-acetylase OafA/YrhL
VGIGRISYALYLYHWPIVVWLVPVPMARGQKTALVLALSFGAAILSYYCVERPCLRWKDRLHDRGGSAPASTAAQPAANEVPPMAA